jgi:hypothetical protein
MRGQPGFFDIDDRLRRLSDLGDQLAGFRAVSDFEIFRPELAAALAYSDGAQGGRLPFDPVMMFKIFVIQATNNLSDKRVEFLDRLATGWRFFYAPALGQSRTDAGKQQANNGLLSTVASCKIPAERHIARTSRLIKQVRRGEPNEQRLSARIFFLATSAVETLFFTEMRRHFPRLGR